MKHALDHADYIYGSHPVTCARPYMSVIYLPCLADIGHELYCCSAVLGIDWSVLSAGCCASPDLFGRVATPFQENKKPEK